MHVIYLREEVTEKAKENEGTHNTNSESNVYPISMNDDFTFYTCEVCDKKFAEKEALQRHYSFHIVGKPFVCKKCDSTFMRLSALTMHSCPADAVLKPVRSEVRKEEANSQLQVAKLRTEKPFICEVCDVRFRFKRSLKMHLKESKCVTAYNCSICFCNFRQLSGLANHHNKIHLHVDVKEEYTGKNESQTQSDLPPICELCGMKFSKKVYLIQHLPSHKGKDMSNVVKNLEKEEVFVTEIKNEKISEKPTTCEVCGKKFTKRHDVLRHMATHTGVKAYQCDVCSKYYATKATLLVHKRRFHSGLRPYACHLCPKAFLRKPELDTHCFVHKDSKPFTCGDCETGFCHRKSLERHNRMQTCIRLPQSASTENTLPDMSDASSSEEQTDFDSPSEPDEVRFKIPEPLPNKRITRSSSAKSTGQNTSVNTSESLRHQRNKSAPSASTKSVKSYHLSIKRTNGSRKFPSGGEEQITIQQYFPSNNKRLKTNISSIRDKHSVNSHLLTITESVSTTDEESYGFSCDICCESFKLKEDLMQHYSVHTIEGRTEQQSAKKTPKPYECNICGECFRLKRELASHSTAHDAVKEYICVDCNVCFPDESVFNAHVCRNQRFDASSSVCIKPDNGKQDEQQKTSYGLFVCTTCSKSFALEKELKYHLSSHDLNKGFFCDICPKAFYLEKDLNNHVLSHSKKNSYPCKVCNEVFDLQRNLQKHLLNHFSSGLICKHCHMGFEHEADLSNHINTCPSKNNFVCDVCYRSFLLKCALVSHAKTHQRALEKKRFHCEVCGRTFLKNVDLKQHLRSHTAERRHFCPECGKGYFLKASLRAHLRYHSADRPHTCHLCDKKYVCKRDLEIHYLKHTDRLTSSYICDACGKGFCLKEGLERHLITEHGKSLKRKNVKHQVSSSDIELDAT